MQDASKELTTLDNELALEYARRDVLAYDAASYNLAADNVERLEARIASKRKELGISPRRWEASHVV